MELKFWTIRMIFYFWCTLVPLYYNTLRFKKHNIILISERVQFNEILNNSFFFMFKQVAQGVTQHHQLVLSRLLNGTINIHYIIYFTLSLSIVTVSLSMISHLLSSGRYILNFAHWKIWNHWIDIRIRRLYVLNILFLFVFLYRPIRLLLILMSCCCRLWHGTYHICRKQ